jgi:hypothetical protein
MRKLHSRNKELEIETKSMRENMVLGLREKDAVSERFQSESEVVQRIGNALRLCIRCIPPLMRRIDELRNEKVSQRKRRGGRAQEREARKREKSGAQEGRAGRERKRRAGHERRRRAGCERSRSSSPLPAPNTPSRPPSLPLTTITR